MKRPKPPSQAELTLSVENWNLKHPVGTPVAVRLDSGLLMQSATESAALVLNGHSAVIMLRGISGSYMLSRVTAEGGKPA